MGEGKSLVTQCITISKFNDESKSKGWKITQINFQSSQHIFLKYNNDKSQLSIKSHTEHNSNNTQHTIHVQQLNNGNKIPRLLTIDACTGQRETHITFVAKKLLINSEALGQVITSSPVIHLESTTCQTVHRACLGWNMVSIYNIIHSSSTCNILLLTFHQVTSKYVDNLANSQRC